MTGAVVYWLLVLSEGVYLGRRVVVWLYDLSARRYEGIKQFDPYYERLFLGEPIVQALPPGCDVVLLDIATGTGRLRRSLPPEATHIQVVGLDRSRAMLLAGRAADASSASAPLVQADALCLPFATASLAAVACLEALEFLPDTQAALVEMARVLRHDGLLVTTNRKGRARWLMPGHVFPRDRFVAMLADAGFSRVCIERWQVDYDLVTARRR